MYLCEGCDEIDLVFLGKGICCFVKLEIYLADYFGCESGCLLVLVIWLIMVIINKYCMKIVEIE